MSCSNIIEMMKQKYITGNYMDIDQTQGKKV